MVVGLPILCIIQCYYIVIWLFLLLQKPTILTEMCRLVHFNTIKKLLFSIDDYSVAGIFIIM